ncbi:hypothetical protein AQZ59_01444 [Trueperella bernardiae]|uniref:DUF998 domain-containing protein n=1 Tax=Trueperella bernardiae TaxID=59561 RepID=A0A0W1KHV2_9ACTO|nr:DUF998 domain-containing protein [Trueperella bernardiae]KTF03656.1 hypothetical protein AQZ59_01444 [Trueperella bernardiae]
MLIAAIALTLGALAYASVLTEAALGYPLSPTVSYLSELSAADQASSALVRSMDAAAGVAFAAVGFYLWSRRRGAARDLLPGVRWGSGHAGELDAGLAGARGGLPGAAGGAGVGGRLAGLVPERVLVALVPGGMALAGIATVLDAAFPMDCAESVPSCRAQLEAGTSFSHLAHTVTSSLAGLGLVAVAVGALLAGTRVMQAVGAVVVGAMGVELVTIAAGWPVGIAQRVQVAASVVLMLMIAARMGGGHVGDPARTGSRSA